MRASVCFFVGSRGKTQTSQLARFQRISRALLEDSPHIAAYITRLNIGFVSKTPAADIESLREIFDKLENVHLCIIDGMDLLIRYFPKFCPVLLDFLEHRSLRHFFPCFFRPL
jgi:hypothetical protein